MFGEGTVANGTDTFDGGDGRDLVSYAVRSADLIVKLDGAANDGASGENDNVEATVERVDAGRGDDLLEGGAGPDDLYGGVGDDEIWGRAGDDLLRGAGGNDEMHGEDGDDTLFGGQQDDTLDGGNDNDAVNGGPGDDTATGGDGGHDTVHGDDGNDVVGPATDACCSFSDIAFGDAGDDMLNAEALRRTSSAGPERTPSMRRFASAGPTARCATTSGRTP